MIIAVGKATRGRRKIAYRKRMRQATRKAASLKADINVLKQLARKRPKRGRPSRLDKIHNEILTALRRIIRRELVSLLTKA